MRKNVFLVANPETSCYNIASCDKRTKGGFFHEEKDFKT